MGVVYSSLLLAALVAGAPYWLARMATSGHYRAGLAGRLGRVPESLRAAVAGRDVIWLHAVSVGEVMAAARLVQELEQALPGWVVAVSTTTATGQAVAKQKLAGSPVFYLPLDFAFAVRRYLKVLRPKMLVLMESELWPRLLEECARAAIPVMVVNARISDRSFPRYIRLRRLWRPLLAKVTLFLAQSEESAERLVKIGAPAERVRLVGNLKYDVQAGRGSETGNEMTRRLGALLAGAKPVVAGSTLAGEEEALLAAWPAVLAGASDAVLVLAPRHPQRFEEVLKTIRRSGYPFVQCSRLSRKTAPMLLGVEPLARDTVFLLDTIGDLGAVYSLAAVAFVGGSLVTAGGHNPLEPARFGVPVVMGPSYENFRDVVGRMRQADGIRIVKDGDELSATLIELLKDCELAGAIGERGRAVFASQAGATARTVQALTAILRQNAVER